MAAYMTRHMDVGKAGKGTQVWRRRMAASITRHRVATKDVSAGVF